MLRFLDNDTYIGSFKVPLLRSGFRMVVFSIIIMCVVLFFSRGIMGDKELSVDSPRNAVRWLKAKLSKTKKQPETVQKGGADQ